MCTDHNIHHALFQVCDGLPLLCCRPETGQHVDSHREILHPLYKGIVMLLRKNRCRDKINHLFSLLYCLKRRTDGNFRLPVANIPTNQAVHDLRALHVLFRRINGKQLILRLLKGKHLFKFPLPDRILSARITVFLLTRRIKLHQILRHLAGCFPDL